MGENIAIYRYGTIVLHGQWEGCRVRIATDEETGRTRACLADMCAAMGVKNIQLQANNLRRAQTGDGGYEIADDSLTSIEFPPLGEVKERGRSQPQHALDVQEVGWWAAHINTNLVDAESRDSIKGFHREVKLALTTIYFQHAIPMEMTRLALPRKSAYTCEHDFLCPCGCRQWYHITGHGDEPPTITRIIDM